MGCQETARGAVIAGAGNSHGFKRQWTMHIVMVLALAVSTFPVSAESMRASGEQAVKAQAYLDFRIVIPETLHIDSRAERRKKSQTFVSRTIQSEDGRTVVTVARP